MNWETVQATTLYEVVKKMSPTMRYIGKNRDSKINWACYEKEKDFLKYRHLHSVICYIKPNEKWYRIQSHYPFSELETSDFQAKNDADAIIKTREWLRVNVKNYKEISKKHILFGLSLDEWIDFSLTTGEINRRIKKLKKELITALPASAQSGHSIYKSREEILDIIENLEDLLKQYSVLKGV